MSEELKERKANRIFIFSTFGLFTAGLDKFDKAHEEGLITGVLHIGHLLMLLSSLIVSATIFLISLMDENPELNYHKDNEEYLMNIMAEIAIMSRRGE